MKKLTFCIVFLSVIFSLQAQMITVSVPVITANPGQTVNVPVTVVSGASSSGTPVGAIDLNIDYNDQMLTFIGLVNFYPAMPGSEWVYSGNLSTMAANWIDGSLLTEAIPDGTVLYEMQFTYNFGNSPLVFSKYEFYDVNYELIPTTPVNGAVNASIVLQNVTFQVDMSRETISPNGVHLAGSFNNWNYSLNEMTNNGSGIFSLTLPLEQNTTYTYRFVNGNSEAGLEIVPADCGVLNGSGQYERQLVLGNEPITTGMVCFGRCSVCPPMHNVTFRVDMANTGASANGVHLAGSFNNWDYSSTEMILAGAGAVYEVTLQLEEGQYYEYKFVNGNTLQDAEIVPEGCSNNGNRYFSVPNSDLILNPYCFGECAECGSLPEFYDITFMLDMKNETVSPEGIHIAGSFQGWQPGATSMVDEGDDIYSYTHTILEGSSVEYRFVNGNTSSGYESVPSQCSIDGNRFFNSISGDTILPVVCFSACDSCQQPEVMVTFRVDMSEVSVSPQGMHLSGSFQGWDPSATPLSEGEFNIYSATFSLPVGSYQQFRFVNGDTEAGYENVPVDCAENNNRYLTIPETDTILPPYCFASCELCPVGVLWHTKIKERLLIYPNPASNNVYIEFNEKSGNTLVVSIYDYTGKLVLGQNFESPGSGNQVIPVNTASLSPGIYLITLNPENTEERISAKLIIKD